MPSRDPSSTDADPKKPFGARVSGAANDVGDFWTRVTNGMAIDQLWRQFRSEASEGYGLYSREVDWGAMPQKKGIKRFFRSAWALFQVMLMKLSPARRILMLLAVGLFFFPVIAIFLPHAKGEGSENFFEFSAIALFILLALELADRVIMKRDLEIAREIQRWLVPHTPPAIAGVDIAFATRPANTVAGDYYDAFERPAAPGSNEPGPLLLVVADVAGKSVPAALLMATFQASLHTLAAAHGPLDELVRALNRYACAHSLDGLRFTTAFFAELDASHRSLTYVVAGHNAPVLRRADGRIERLTEGGPPLGIVSPGLPTGYDCTTIAIAPGDALIIFTDGVVEARDHSESEYGETRMISCIQSVGHSDASSILQQMMSDVDRFVGATRQHDDVTCLVLKLTS
jgi:sigma-B regulation protein RsbU (phosphoserine phosphatase)